MSSQCQHTAHKIASDETLALNTQPPLTSQQVTRCDALSTRLLKNVWQKPCQNLCPCAPLSQVKHVKKAFAPVNSKTGKKTLQNIHLVRPSYNSKMQKKSNSFLSRLIEYSCGSFLQVLRAHQPGQQPSQKQAPSNWSRSLRAGHVSRRNACRLSGTAHTAENMFHRRLTTKHEELHKLFGEESQQLFSNRTKSFQYNKFQTRSFSSFAQDEFDEFLNTNAYDGVFEAGANNLGLCTVACLNNAACVAFDLASSGRCFLHLDINNLQDLNTQATNVNHYRRRPNDDPNCGGQGGTPTPPVGQCTLLNTFGQVQRNTADNRYPGAALGQTLSGRSIPVRTNSKQTAVF